MSDFGGSHYVTGLAPATPSTSTPDYVSMKNHSKIEIIICCDNATTVTGSAITVKQATDAAATGEKAVGFTTVLANTDTAAGSALTATAVTSDTFTTDATNAKNLLYIIQLDENDMDLAGGFDYIRCGTADATSTVLSVVYRLSGPRYAPSYGQDVIT